VPQAELKYSADLDIPCAEMLAEIERVILRHDPGAGACKGRAYPSDTTHHTHILIEVSMLDKPHRDAGFQDALVEDIDRTCRAMVQAPCEFATALRFSPRSYLTGSHSGGIQSDQR